MERLTTTGGWNPFLCVVNGTTYEVKDIRFFKDGKVICSVGRGWFGNNNRLGTLDVPDIFYRRKENFSTDAFVIPTGTPKEVFLYINFDFFDFTVEDYIEPKGHYQNVYNQYKSKKVSGVSFIDYGSRREVVNTKAKEWADTLTVIVGGVRDALTVLEEELKSLDPHGRIYAERANEGKILKDSEIRKQIMDYVQLIRFNMVIKS